MCLPVSFQICGSFHGFTFQAYMPYMCIQLRFTCVVPGGEQLGFCAEVVWTHTGPSAGECHWNSPGERAETALVKAKKGRFEGNRSCKVVLLACSFTLFALLKPGVCFDSIYFLLKKELPILKPSFAGVKKKHQVLVKTLWGYWYERYQNVPKTTSLAKQRPLIPDGTFCKIAY